MPDTIDYLFSGVMNGNPFGIAVPFDTNDLEIAALDAADDIIEQHRRADPAFDAACDERAIAWTWEHVPLSRLRVGHHVLLQVAGGPHGRRVDGRVTDIGTHWVQVYGGSSFPVSAWDETSRVLAPVPLDLATLGKYRGGPSPLTVDRGFKRGDRVRHLVTQDVGVVERSPAPGKTTVRFPNSWRASVVATFNLVHHSQESR